MRNESVGVFHSATALLWFLADVYLHKDLRSRGSLRDGVGEVHAINALPHIDNRGQRRHLVGLQSANEVHAKTIRFGGLQFGDELLGIVLPNVVKTERVRYGERVGSEAFRDRQDFDCLTPDCSEARLHSSEPVGYQ